MIKSKSKTVEIGRNVEFVYDYLKNFSNFSMIANDKIEEFKATEDKCSFKVKNMGEVNLKILTRIPNERITIVTDPDAPSAMPVNFVVNIDFAKLEPYRCSVVAAIELDVPQMMALMIKKQLEKALDTLVEGLKMRMESIM